MEQNKGNPRKFWRNINEISGLGKNKSKKGIDKILGENGNKVEKMEAAEYMNSYYTEAGPNLAMQIKAKWNPSENFKNS